MGRGIDEDGMWHKWSCKCRECEPMYSRNISEHSNRCTCATCFGIPAKMQELELRAYDEYGFHFSTGTTFRKICDVMNRLDNKTAKPIFDEFNKFVGIQNVAKSNVKKPANNRIPKLIIRKDNCNDDISNRSVK